jgi:cytochrome c556
MAMLLGLAAIAGETPTPKYVKQMQDMDAAAMGLQESIEAKNWSGVAKTASSLRSLLKVTQTFWEQRKSQDGAAFATAALKAVTDAEAAAKAKDEKGLAVAWKALNNSCNGCHKTHRERTPDGKYAIK